MFIRKLNILFILVFVTVLSGCTGDVSGVVQVKNADGSFGSVIEGASVTFENEDGSGIAQRISSSAGRYELTLDTGRYIVNATHDDYVYIPGGNPTYLVVVAGSNTANFFMEPR